MRIAAACAIEVSALSLDALCMERSALWTLGIERCR
jgi:hypothetical protein